jgi:hypothetical protein
MILTNATDLSIPRLCVSSMRMKHVHKVKNLHIVRAAKRLPVDVNSHTARRQE